MILRVDAKQSWRTAMEGYEAELRRIIEQFPTADILELGGGRYPAFRGPMIPENVNTYTINDIDADELSRAPSGYEKACFDVVGDVSGFEQRYDIVFSRFLAEHVKDGRALHENVYRLLRPGGVAFHLIPTLYASPFVVNKLAPHAFADKLLPLIVPIRRISPRFPAYYSQCYGNGQKMRSLFSDLGYSSVQITNFYGHFYYDRLPVLRQIHELFSSFAAARDWSLFSSYAYILAYK